jgi:hypothetical protein
MSIFAACELEEISESEMVLEVEEVEAEKEGRRSRRSR